MPFDPTPIETPNKILIYRQRRESAAALWANVPRKLFNMRKWGCGSKACALGWLAHEEHDGWEWEMDRGYGTPIGPDGCRSYRGAANYFGITLAQASACFGVMPSFHERWFVSHITPADVVKTLIALPYTVKEEP